MIIITCSHLSVRVQSIQLPMQNLSIVTYTYDSTKFLHEVQVVSRKWPRNTSHVMKQRVYKYIHHVLSIQAVDVPTNNCEGNSCLLPRTVHFIAQLYSVADWQNVASQQIHTCI
jgi:hypothetical protein